MYGLAIGVSNVGESLPRIAYALLSGLNAATVGIIVLAAVQLSEKAITDKMTRIVVFVTASAGMLYNALWYFPLLMALGGLTAIAFDFRWFHGPVRAALGMIPGRRTRRGNAGARGGDGTSDEEEAEIEMQIRRESHLAERSTGSRVDNISPPSVATPNNTAIIQAVPSSTVETEPRVVPQDRRLAFAWKSGLALIIAFFISFTVVMVLRGTLSVKPRLYSLFANMYLAGTIIFGGGPVVIPLLREYIVAENWVSPRDFLIGLALIQAFPGPNFNFAVYLGSLTAINGGRSSIAGAVIAFLGIFAPGLILVHGTMGIWSAVRGWRAVKSGLRGVNAGAVGLIYTAVYRLWQIGYIDVGFEQGTSLAVEPWWVVVTATSYVGGYWFGVPPAVAIVAGGVMGMVWYGIVSA